MKRLLDVVIAGVSMLVLSPLMALVALMVWATLGRPILFRQERAGLHGCPFRMIKFRTMRDSPDGPDALRLTGLGRWLRAASLDELPGLWNVVKGQMSLVGPRPLLLDYLPRYTARQARRHEVRPGVTGWAQVHGRNRLGWEERLELDAWYIDNRSLTLDLRILFRTVLLVLRREGISQEGEATMQPFRGPHG